MYLCSTCTNEEWPQIKICYILISDCLVYPCKAQGEFDLTSIAPYGPILFSPTLICCCSSDSCLRLSPKSTPFFFNQCPPCCFESTWSSPPPSPHPPPPCLHRLQSCSVVLNKGYRFDFICSLRSQSINAIHPFDKLRRHFEY